MFRFYLNNTLVSDPINWSEFTETIERDDSIKGLLPKYDNSLKFNAGGYDLLYTLIKESGFCNLVELKVEYKCTDNGTYVNILDGYIFLSDCKFNLNQCTVECDVMDNNYGARIFNNKSIEIFLDSSLSKNLTTITPCPSKLVTFFVPSSGLPVVTKRKVYAVWDTLRYFVDWMSDGLIDFESDFFDYTLTVTDNTQRRLSVSRGDLIRNVGAGASPSFSFETLFKELNKKYPISFTISKQANGRPLIKIENDSYFLGSDSGIIIDSISDLTQSINNQNLFSEINVGGTTVAYNAAIHTIPYTYPMYFQNESYYFQTACNIDNKLDLVSSFICDSNIIEELVATNTTNASYDLNTFFVEVSYSNGVGGNTADGTSLLSSSVLPYYYNGFLTNLVVSQNQEVYADLIQYINSNDIGFEATKLIPNAFTGHDLVDYSYGFGGIISPLSSSTDLITFEDDYTLPNHDAGGNYTLNSRYTAPSIGHYYFKTNLALDITTALTSTPFSSYINPNIKISFDLYIIKYNAANTVIETYTKNIPYVTFMHTGGYNIDGEKVFFLEVGDYVNVKFRWTSLPFKAYDAAGHYNNAPTNGNVTVLAGTSTYFKTTSTASNGTLTSGSSLDYNVYKLEFNRPLSNDEYSTLKLDLSKSVNVNYNGLNNKIGWIRKTTRNLYNSSMEWELISNSTNSQ